MQSGINRQMDNSTHMIECMHFYMVFYSLGPECMYVYMVFYSLGPECMHFYMVLYSLGLECMHFYMTFYSIMIECIYFYIKICTYASQKALFIVSGAALCCSGLLRSDSKSQGFRSRFYGKPWYK